MSSNDVGTIVSTFTGNVSDILVANIPVVLAVVAGILGLYFVLRLVKRYVK